jgi:hypothetical protein
LCGIFKSLFEIKTLTSPCHYLIASEQHEAITHIGINIHFHSSQLFPPSAHGTMSTPPPPPLSMQEVLEILLLCFEAAADLFPSGSFAYAKSTQSAGFTFWEIWETAHLDDPPADLTSISFPPEDLFPGRARLNLCDFFCTTLETEVDRIMRQFFGASARWIMFQPRPAFVLRMHVPGHSAQDAGAPAHSVLEVKEQCGSTWYMDGTVQQFGWARSTWFLPWRHFEARLGSGIYIAGDEHKKKVAEVMNNDHEGLWALTREIMKKLFTELDWDNLALMQHEQRIGAVKKQAQDSYIAVENAIKEGA